MRTEAFKNSSKLLFRSLIICSLLSVGCSKNGNEQDNTTFDYLSDTFEVSFRTQGTIPAPTIEWRGEEGTFSLKNEISGLAIDEVTGKIQWQRSLDIGEYLVEIMAKNDQSVLETSFVLTNVLKKSLWNSGQNSDTASDEIDFDRSFTFYEDGTLEVSRYSSPDFKGVGVWEINGNQIEIHACLCSDIAPQSVPEYDEHTFYEGTLINEETIAYISGQWSVIRFNPDSTMLRGNFYLEWD